MKKECELCNLPAKTYCESDEASLCWNCDWKIHSANFLVAKHERSLLCHLCQFPTQWKSSGSKLGSTLSICENCLKNNCKGRSVFHQRNQQQDEQDESEGENEEDSEEAEEEEDTDNQVVPWSSTDQASSSSNSEESSSLIKAVSMKRMRENNEEEQDDICCSSSSSGNKEEEVTSMDCMRPLKQRKIDEEEFLSGVNESESDLLVQSLKKFHQKMLLVHCSNNA